MGKSKRFCLQCDDGTVMVHGARDIDEMIDTVALHVSRVRGWHCPRCGDIYFDDGEGERYSAAVFAASKEADTARRVEIRAIRKKLKLTQAVAAEIFGGGINAFSEYERGKTRPHKSTMLLLRLLSARPELLDNLLHEQIATQTTRHRRDHGGVRTTRQAAVAPALP